MKKNLLAKIMLFICTTILLAILYYKVVPIINVYGMQALYIKNYTDTEEFKSTYR